MLCMSGTSGSVKATMKKQASMIVILCSLLLHLAASFMQKRYILNMLPNTTRTGMICIQGLLFLLYPVLGYVADVRLSRYRTIKTSVVMLVISGAMAVVLAGSDSVVTALVYVHIHGNHWYATIGALMCVCVFTVGVLGVGLFEANAIQFGLDQLLEAPTPKLITFIHWYYWSQNVGGLIFFTYVLPSYYLADAQQP